MRLRVWGFLRASLLVGVLSAAFCVNAETVTVPPALEQEIDTLIRSILRATYEDAWIVEDGELFWSDVSDVTNQLNFAIWDLSDVFPVLSDIISSIESAMADVDSESPVYASLSDAAERAQSLQESLQSTYSTLEGASESLGSALSYVHNEQILRSAEMQVTPGSPSGGGSCDCPDYSEVLTSLRLILTRIDISVSNIYQQLDSIVQNYLQYWDADFLAFFEDFAVTISQRIYQHQTQSTPSAWWHNIGYSLAPIISNTWSMARAYESWGRSGTIFGDKYHFGDGIASAVWNDIMFPIASLLAPVNDVQVNPLADNPMTEAMRDYYMCGRNNHPTNTVDNPLWVAFTNSVSFDSESLADALDDIDVRVKGVFDVAVTNFPDLVDLLQDTVLYVSITNVNNNYLNAEFDFAEEKLDEVSDPQNELPEPENIDTSHIRSFTSRISGIVDAYGSAFGSVPDDMPQDIMIHQGWTVGGIEVQSIHYKASDDAKYYRWIHNLFSVVWGLILVSVIVAAGVFGFVICFYAMMMCGAMFLGKPALVLRLVRSFVSEFTGFFQSRDN